MTGIISISRRRAVRPLRSGRIHCRYENASGQNSHCHPRPKEKTAPPASRKSRISPQD
ncbi:hypothetical protein NBRC3257_2605 [Gluconobacter thailandicus NBRC 3257]|uniref:Transposase n=1 Tax=Gluconobacter thailandicus NBRC 3257 TaxID=1381097 RepID=A0ABQ0IZI1_GLUTH|nr:hypothetical protein NBRC3255_2089 [Gluconobacter thailandicus NBRC 3255]GAD27606.1 hypothetical protein NBRC3257_2605 [Gluconobacter thailandicus NBRC 3257]